MGSLCLIYRLAAVNFFLAGVGTVQMTRIGLYVSPLRSIQGWLGWIGLTGWLTIDFDRHYKHMRDAEARGEVLPGTAAAKPSPTAA